MNGNDILALAERMRGFLREIGPLLGKRLDLIEGSVSADGAYGVATARSQSDEAKSLIVRHEILVKLLIAEGDGGSEEWALLFHYIDGRLVAPAGVHYMRFVRSKASGGAEWRNIGWEADEYEEWSELTELGSDQRPPQPLG